MTIATRPRPELAPTVTAQLPDSVWAPPGTPAPLPPLGFVLAVPPLPLPLAVSLPLELLVLFALEQRIGRERRE
jgi:hypothetical protein